MSLARRTLSLVALVFSIALSSCDTTPTGPGSFLGNELEATINGTTHSFFVDPKKVTYDAAVTYSTVPGATTSGTITRSLTLFFGTDINAGTFPRALPSDEINMVYVESNNGVAVNFDCSTHRDECNLSVTASSGGIVDGTFTAHLTSRADTTQHVTITGGRFKVRLQ